ncbi:hypothetical protein OG241_06390 [Streptomyces sp. NBC_01390]|uniref:hypothetical protein n=1 Tax=Streptomyces sp. NBC_01390 TaxID=2903850 RepID=UPI00324D4153
MNQTADHPAATPSPDPDEEDLSARDRGEAYARFRPGAPEEVAWLLADAMTGMPAVTLLALGAGSGQVATARLPALERPVHVDLVGPSRFMLREAAATSTTSTSPPIAPGADDGAVHTSKAALAGSEHHMPRSGLGLTRIRTGKEGR